MILLNEIAQKLEAILNGTDIETMEFSRPTDFEFAVETSGYHLDHIYDKVTGKNFLPVFITSMGGSYDPVIGVKRNTYNVSVTIYFPVSFKEQMYTLNEYLVNCFVGTQRNYGALSGKCLSNISVPEYGEIQDLDLNQFQSWVQNVYQKRIDVMQPYMTMTFVLYLVNAGEDFVFGNSVEYRMTINIPRPNFLYTFGSIHIRYYRNEIGDVPDMGRYSWVSDYDNIFTNTKTITPSTKFYNAELDEILGEGTDYQETTPITEKLKWTSAGTGVDNSPASQQLINVDKYAKNVVNITNYSKSIAVYIQNNEFWKTILNYYNNQDINSINSITLTKVYHYKMKN